ncbi:MAG: retroviral-like aspartic protease family protein [Vampirovibrio sp.]|nr:retroviral-like aspartic protease family protein [Vampirovibrio sp.]
MNQVVLAIGLAVVLTWSGTLGAFAESRVQQDREDAAVFFSQLASQTDNPVFASMAKDNLKRLSGQGEPQMRESEIRIMKQRSNSLAVPAVLNRKVMGTFLMDTGASYTVITPRIARKLKVKITRNTPQISVVTANGVVRAPLVTIPTMSIGDVEVRNVKAVVKDLGNDLLLAGLLGMNFFDGMEFTVKGNSLVIRRPFEDKRQVETAWREPEPLPDIHNIRY